MSGLLDGGRRRAVAAVVMGVVGLAVLVPTTAMTGREASQLAAVAVGTATVSALAAWMVLPRLGHRSLGTQLAVVAGLPAVGVFLGAWAGAELMFLSEHDAAVLQVVLVAAVASAWASAFLLGDRVGRAGAALAATTRALGDGVAPPDGPQPGSGASRELDAVASELADTARRLREARERAAALESSRRELIAWVSHDLRTPLAGIRAVAEALEDGVAEDQATVDRYHTTLRVEAERLAELVDDLFELSRAEAGVVELELQRVPLADLVSDALAGVAPVAQAKGVRLEGRVGATGDALVSPPELLRALRNVLENAVRHTPRDGAVVVEAAVDGDDAVVSVLDAGGGIPDEHLERIFEAGFRGDVARTPGENGGTGLGLAIARGLVEAHRGRIDVANEPGGARFTVRVPVGADGVEGT